MMTGGKSMSSEHGVMALADPAKCFFFLCVCLNEAELICGNSPGPCD